MKKHPRTTIDGTLSKADIVPKATLRIVRINEGSQEKKNENGYFKNRYDCSSCPTKVQSCKYDICTVSEIKNKEREGIKMKKN